MTREEARELLEFLKIMDAPKLREAVDMAIEALQERPKGRWIELPCEVGDTVYEVYNNVDACNSCKFFYEDSIDWTSCRNENVADTDDFDGYFPDQQEYPVCEKQFMDIKERQPNIDWIFNHRNQFGKTLFLTKEEAEKALADMRESE